MHFYMPQIKNRYLLFFFFFFFAEIAGSPEQAVLFDLTNDLRTFTAFIIYEAVKRCVQQASKSVKSKREKSFCMLLVLKTCY